jgi:hypothetical protein
MNQLPPYSGQKCSGVKMQSALHAPEDESHTQGDSIIGCTFVGVQGIARAASSKGKYLNISKNVFEPKHVTTKEYRELNSKYPFVGFM